MSTYGHNHEGEVTNASGANRTTMPPHNSWDAAALLNPRGFNADSKQRPASPAQLLSNGLKHHTNGQPNLQFQFSNASDSSSGYSQPSSSSAGLEAANSVSAPTQNGMTSMIERMNNLQDRRSVPMVKRRKIDEDASHQTPRNAFSSGSSGMLSEHVHQKQQDKQSTPAALQSQSTLDLTGGTCSFPFSQCQYDTEVWLTLIGQETTTK